MTPTPSLASRVLERGCLAADAQCNTNFDSAAEVVAVDVAAVVVDEIVAVVAAVEQVAVA